MKNNFAKKVISLSCAAILCVSCAISASASTKTSTTDKYCTKYGTFQGRLNCTRGTDKAAALASTDCYFKGYVKTIDGYDCIETNLSLSEYAIASLQCDISSFSNETVIIYAIAVPTSGANDCWTRAIKTHSLALIIS